MKKIHIKKITAVISATVMALISLSSLVAAETSDWKYSFADVDGNGRLEANDYVLVKRAYFETYKLSDREFERADINGNGMIDSLDYAMVKRLFFKPSYAETVISLTSENASLYTKPPTHYSYQFENHSQLLKEIKDEQSILSQEVSECGKAFQLVYSSLCEGDTELVTPAINGKALPYEAEGGVALFTSELYYFPWIWSDHTVDGQSISVKICYASALGDRNIDKAKTYLEFLNSIPIAAPNPSNREEYPHYKAIYEKEFELYGGKHVVALVYELKDNDDCCVMFCMDGMLVVVSAEGSMLTDEFFASFGLVPIE